MSNDSDIWIKSNLEVFWGEIAPCDHIVQMYENDDIFFNTLVGFVEDGFSRNESVVIIATTEHLTHLSLRLESRGVDLVTLIANGQYIPCEVDKSISEIMLNNWPDEMLFTRFVTTLLQRAQMNNRKVRVFGEIVATLWAQGLNGASVQLEHLWNGLQQKESFCLYCAYPKAGFTQDVNSSIENICRLHAKVINGSSQPSTDIYYKASS